MAWRIARAPVPAQYEHRETGTDDPHRDIPEPDRKVDSPPWVEVESGFVPPDPEDLPPVTYRWKKWTRKIADAKDAEGFCGLAGAPK